MNKFFAKLAGALSLVALVAGAGVAIASGANAKGVKADSETISLVPDKDSTGNSSTSYVTTHYGFDYKGVHWSFNQWNPSSLQIKTNQSSAGAEFNFFTGEFPGPVTEVVLTFSAMTVSTETGFKLAHKDSAYTSAQSSDGDTMTWNASSKTLTWSNSSSSDTAIAFYQNGKVATGTNKISKIDVTYTSGGESSTMVVKNSSGDESPYQLMYGNPGGILLYAYEDDGETQITSGVTWTSSDPDLLVVDDDFSDNHCWVKTDSKIGEGTVTASKEDYTSVVSTINVVPGDVDSLEITGSMTYTSYKVDDNWNPAGFTVTATYESGYVADVTSEVEWSYNPAKATSTSVNSVVATASFGGETAVSDSQSVTVSEGVTYDLTAIDGFSSWTTAYGAHTVTSENVGASIGATMNFSITNKQSSGVGSTYPCIGTKTDSEVECLKFTLTEENKKISSIDITFVTRYTSTYPSLYLHKGSGVSSASIADLTMSDSQESEHSLSYNGNLNDTVFTVGYNAHQTKSNGAVGIKSISIGLVEQGSYGTTHHIKVTQFPNLVYHVGEVFDSTGLQVFAYDGADESTANFKDVTSEVDMGHTSGIYTFSDSDVPTSNMWLCYVENDTHYYADDIVFQVYAVAEYELVDTALSDWSGNYLIVGTNASEELVAMNGGLANPDVEGGYKAVTDNDGVIEAGQELEWVVAKSSGDAYTIKGKSGKYIGSLTAKDNGMLVSDTGLNNTFSISGSDATIQGTNEYNLTFNTSGNGRFRYYSSGTVKLYRLKVSDKADEYAQIFLGAFTCDATGESEPTFNEKEAGVDWSWSLLASAYNELTPAEKEQFRLAVPSQTGTNIEKAVARYDLVVGKYGTDKYADFMGREPAALRNVVTPASNAVDSNSAMIIITVIALTSISSIAVLLVIKRRKAIR